MVNKFNVTGMSCSACSAAVERTVSKLSGVNKVSVNLLTNSMEVDYDEAVIKPGDIAKAVKKKGYGARLVSEGGSKDTHKEAEGENEKNAQATKLLRELILSLIFLVPLMYISMGHMIYEGLGLEMPVFYKRFFHGPENGVIYGFTQIILLMPIVIANQRFFKNGFRNLWKLSPNMDSLVAVGAGAAILYGVFAMYNIGYGIGHGDMAAVEHYMKDLYFESAGTILTLITVGKYLEARSKGKTSEAINKLMKLSPDQVSVIRDEQEIKLPAAQLNVGDIVVVRPGESVAVDGIVIEGSSSFNESAITGESLPVYKQTGDRVISATINQGGMVKVKAEKIGADTTISRIIKLVESASATKAPIAKIADKIAGVFVPVVMTIALLTGIVWLLTGATFEFAMSCGIAVLVISCPCALGLATPVAIMVGTGKGAENGILIKSGEALEQTHNIDTVVLDKTGTITEGKPSVTDIYTEDEITEEKLIYIGATMEKASEHPLAEAVVAHAAGRNIQLGQVEGFYSFAGKGIKGTVDGVEYYSGNLSFYKEIMSGSQAGAEGPEGQINAENLANSDNISFAALKEKIEEYGKNGKTSLLFFTKYELIGIIAVADTIKENSKAAIKEFKKLGIRVIMLTGDNLTTATAIKEQVETDAVIAGVLPDEKEAEIRKLKTDGHKVAMIGDGVNDAPALASADVGIAIGAGTDIAIESADIVLMKGDLMDAVGAVKLSKAVIKNIKENLFWAFFYNCVGIPLAAGVFYAMWGLKLNPMFGAAAMSLSSVCVVTNALRLRYVKLHKTPKV